MADEPQGSEMSVGGSFTAPLSLMQWVQDYMRQNSLGKSEVIVRALEVLREQDSKVLAA